MVSFLSAYWSVAGEGALRDGLVEESGWGSKKAIM